MKDPPPNIFFLEDPLQIIPVETTHLILSKLYNSPFSLEHHLTNIVYLDLGWEFNKKTNFKETFPNLETLIISMFYMHDINTSEFPVSLKHIISGRRKPTICWREKAYHLENEWFFKMKCTTPETTHIILNLKYKPEYDKWKSIVWNLNLDNCKIEFVNIDEYWAIKNYIYMLVPNENLSECLYKYSLNYLR